MHTYNNEIWILVAGTGVGKRLRPEVHRAALAIGKEISKHECGLVTGGWTGVDYFAASAFVHMEKKKGSRAEHHLLQVIRATRPPQLKAGRIIFVQEGPSEWLEPQFYCDAVILIEGVGGTYGSFLTAISKGVPCFPLGGTGGDAETAFNQMRQLWDIIPNPGISREAFEKIGATPQTTEIAEALARNTISLAIESVRARRGLKPATIFLSYSHRNKAWVNRVSNALQPLVREERITIWSDSEIKPGTIWERELRKKLTESDAAILLVTKELVESHYVRTVELPIIIERSRQDRIQLFWFLVSQCAWEQTGLKEAQAAHDISLTLEELDPATLQATFTELSQRIRRLTSRRFD